MKCSLIIPAYNAEKTITTCLESALHQSLLIDHYEIILVDDGSTDNTSEIVSRYPVRLIQQTNQGPAVARNKGAHEAQGDILVFTDSDCELDFEFLEKIIAPILENPEIIGVQGSYKTKQREFMARYGQVEIETRYSRMAKNKYIDFIGTYAAAYRKDIFHDYGGFDTGFPLASGEDTEFSYKLYENKHKMVFAPEAFVYHQHPIRLKQYLKSKFFRGYWRVRLYKKHPEKAIKDSYTPQSLKIQFFSVPLFLLFLFLSIFNKIWILALLLIGFSFLFFSRPFLRLFQERAYPKRALIPVILFLRATSLFFGMCFGIIKQWK